MKVCQCCGNQFQSDVKLCPKCSSEVVYIGGFDSYAPELAYAGGGFKSEYFSALARLEVESFWFRARNQLIIWALQKYQPGLANFLEVGCGTGFVISGVAEKFPNAFLYGSEIFVAGLSFAAERVARARFMQMDARKVPFAAEFDAIGAFDVLEHIVEDETVLAQLHQALRPEGVLILTVPQHQWLWSAADDYACHVRRYSMQELHGKLLAAGFRIERSSSFVSLLLPAMLLSRLRKKKVNEDYDPQNELKLPRLLNSLFMGLMRAEMVLIRLGLDLPFGGSRLVLARKVG